MRVMDKDIQYVRLASLKGRLKLEKQGIRFKGGATRPRIAAEFGLNPRAPYDVYIGRIQEMMDEALK